jgi:hypothetical protein
MALGNGNVVAANAVSIPKLINANQLIESVIQRNCIFLESRHCSHP